MNKFLLLFFFIWNAAAAQISISITDVNTHAPIPHVTIRNVALNKFIETGEDGKFMMGSIATDINDVLEFFHLNYETSRIAVALIVKSNQVAMTPKRYELQETRIKPIEPIAILKMAYLNSEANHLPKESFVQRVGLTEEFFEKGKCIRFAVSHIDLYQHHKADGEDDRPFYKFGSVPNLKQVYQCNDSTFFQKLMDIVGKRWSKDMYNNLSAVGYVKGINLLNTTFSDALKKNSDVKLRFVSMDTIQNRRAYNIEMTYYKGKVAYMITNVYIDESTFAVAEILTRATDDIEKISLLDFKTKAILWIFGVKFKIHRFYNKISFYQNAEHKWLVGSNIYFVPMEVSIRGNKFMGYFVSKYLIEKKYYPLPTPDRDEIWKKNKRFVGTNIYDFHAPAVHAYPLHPIPKSTHKEVMNMQERNRVLNGRK